MLLPRPRRLRAAFFPVVLFFLMIAPGWLGAQTCPGSWGGDFFWTEAFPPPGIDGVVNAVAVYQGDLYAAGNFDAIGDQPISGIARWDGSAWQPVGTGGPDFVRALAVHGSELYVVAEANLAIEVHRWDGTSWSALPAVPAYGSFDGVTGVASYDGDFYVAGTFLAVIPDGTSRGIVRWDGTEWTFAGKTSNGVDDLTVHDGKLVACFYDSMIDSVSAQHVAAYDGSGWQQVGPGLTGGAPTDLAVYQNDLFAAGGPDGLGGYTVERWDGSSWSVLRTLSGPVEEMTGGAAGLAMSGGFGTPYLALEIYDGAQWTSPGTGPDGAVLALCWDGADLVAGGEFSSMDGVEARRVARWTGGSWSPLGDQSGPGLDGQVNAVASYGGDLIVGGNFTVSADPTISDLARWDGSQWHSLGDVSGIVHALEVYDGMLVVGGTSLVINSVNMNGKLPVWDGATWSYLGLNLYGTVRDLEVWHGDLYAGGNINSYQSYVGPRYVARWTGTDWEALGPGFDYIDSQYRHVFSLGVWNDMLIVGGGFPGVDTVVGPLAAWNGTDWLPLGNLFNEFDFTVWAIESYDGDLYIGGDFCESGGMCRIARYDGLFWSDVGGGLLGEAVYDFQIMNGLLYVTGSPDPDNYTYLGTGIAVWNGSCWRQLGSGLGPAGTYSTGLGMTVHNGALYVGGDFEAAGTAISRNLAGWADPTVLATPGPRSGGAALVLSPPSPNPMGATTSVRFDMAEAGVVRADVYAVDGSRVKRLLDRRLPAGPHSIRWTGEDERGRKVGSGVYFMQVSAGGRSTARRIVVSR